MLPADYLPQSRDGDDACDPAVADHDGRQVVGQGPAAEQRGSRIIGEKAREAGGTRVITWPSVVLALLAHGTVTSLLISVTRPAIRRVGDGKRDLR